MGVFVAEVAAVAFVGLYCATSYSAGALAGPVDWAEEFRAGFARQVVALQPVVFLIGSIGGLLALAVLRPKGANAPLPTWQRAVFATAALVFFWLGAQMTWWLTALALMAPVALGLRWRWRPTVMLLVPVAIPAAATLGAVLGFVTGTAQFVGYGLPSPSYFNLDRTTRAPRWNGGCSTSGFEFLTQVPNNAALSLMGSMFGAMPFSYRGPYPSSEEAFRLIAEEGVPANVDFESGRFSFAGESVRFSTRDAWRFRRSAAFAPAHLTCLASDRLTPLLVLGDVAHGYAWLVDSKTHRLIATYVDRSPSPLRAGTVQIDLAGTEHEGIRPASPRHVAGSPTLHKECGNVAECSSGEECVLWRGVPWSNSTCEILCRDSRGRTVPTTTLERNVSCPDPLSCITSSHGPGAICK